MQEKLLFYSSLSLGKTRRDKQEETRSFLMALNGYSVIVHKGIVEIIAFFFSSLSVETSFRIKRRYRGSRKVSIAEQDELFSQAFCGVKFPSLDIISMCVVSNQ